MALKPGQCRACRLPFLTSKFLNSRIVYPAQFTDIDVQTFDPEKGSLENLAEYATKGATQMGPSSASDWWDILFRINRTKSKAFSTVAHRQSEGLARIR
jgi:hypothetical protein